MTTDWDEDSYRAYAEFEPHFLIQIGSLIADDRKTRLVELLTSQRDAVIAEFKKLDGNLLEFMVSSCLCNDASKCAEALIEGEFGVTMDMDEPELYRLHGAAAELSLKLTKLFLKFGAKTNVKTSLVGTRFDGLLPLDLAVSSLRRRVFWSQEQSIFKLLAKLTGEAMSEPMEVTKLLVKGLSDSEVCEVIFRYVAEGKTIEFASLLLVLSEEGFVVHDCYIPSNVISPGDRMTLRQYVVNEIVNHETEVGKLLVTDSTKLDECMKMKKSLMSILLLLEIFLRTGNRITDGVRLASRTFPATPRSIAYLLEVSGFQLSSHDALYLEKPFGKLGRIPRYTGKWCHEVRNFYPSGLPRLGSLKTMADLGWDQTDPEHQKLLAMGTELEKLSSGVIMNHWTVKDSLFKLIIMLCLAKMKQRLEATRIFAENSEKINEIACCYAKEGKLIELAIILMLAWKKVVDPIIFPVSGDNSKRSLTFQQFIKSELAQATDLEHRLIGRTEKREKGLRKLYKQRKLVMISALHLLEIFERVGDTLQDYVFSEKNVQNEQVVKDVANLLAEAGFKFKTKDIEIKDAVVSPKDVATENFGEAMRVMKSKTEISTESGSQRKSLTRLSYVLPCGFTETQSPYGRPNDMRKFLFQWYAKESYMLSSSVLPFRVLWTSKAGFSTNAKPLEVQQRDIVMGVNRLVAKFPVSRLLTTVASMVTKRN